MPTGTIRPQDRRRFSRVSFQAVVELDFHPGPIACDLVDISLRGALVEAGDPWRVEAGMACTLALELGDHAATISMDGEVAHVAGHRLGIRCTGMDLDSVTSLRRLVEFNLGDEEALHRELAAMVNAA